MTMRVKHNVWKKLLATGSTLGALALGIGSAHAGPDTVNLGALDQGPGLSTEGVKRVGFTAHSYVGYAASDITSVQPVFGTNYTNQVTPLCLGIGAPATKAGTNLFDGDIWFAGCLGIYNGVAVTVTIKP